MGLLIEEQRTNYVDNSTILSPDLYNNGTGVAPQVGTVTTVGPDGVSASITRCQLDRGTGNTVNDFSFLALDPNTPSANYSQSIWLKSNDTNNYVLQFYDFGGNKGKEITVTPQWQRFTLDASTSYKNSNDTATTTPSLVVGLRNDPTNANYFTGNTNSQTADILVWGPQIENGTFVTSYISTAGTALTRNADVASITGTNFSSWYNQSEGTVFVKGATNDIDGNTGWASFYQASSPNNNRISVRQSPTLITSAGTTIGLSASSSPTPKEIQKISTAYKNDDFALYSTVFTPVRVSAGSVPVSVDTALLGGVEGTGGTFNLNGTISRLTYYPYRLSDVRLQTITS